jgi:hypothetical protein
LLSWYKLVLEGLNAISAQTRHQMYIAKAKEDLRSYCPNIYTVDAHSCISAFFALIPRSDVCKAFYGHRSKKIFKNLKKWKVYFEECIYPEGNSFIWQM